MGKIMLTRSYFIRSLAVCAAVGLLGTTVACGGTEPGEQTGEPDRTTDTSSTTHGGAGDGFCDSVDGIEEELLALAVAEDDPTRFVEVAARAAERFSTVEPPEQIAAEWQSLGDFFTLVDESLQGVEVTSKEELDQALNLEGEEAFVMLLRLPGQTEVVGVYVQDECQVDLGITPPAVEDVCAAIDPANLGSVFDGQVPEGENRRWGGGMVECFWSDGDREVGVVVMPAETMQSELLEDANQLDSVAFDGAPIDVYDGAFGPLRGAAGRTAATVVGDTGVLASVRSGDPQAEAQKAIALVGLVAVDL